MSGVEPSPPSVDGHGFVAPPGAPWERCVHIHADGRRCGLAESAHTTLRSPSYAVHLSTEYGVPLERLLPRRDA